MAQDDPLTVDASALEGMDEDVREALTITLDKVENEMLNRLARNAPTHSGFLRGSFFRRRLDPFDRAIFSEASYALLVQTGTRPHVITPNEAEALRFVVGGGPQGGGGEVVFATRVFHPGTDAQPYITESIEDVNERVPEFVRTSFEEVGL